MVGLLVRRVRGRSRSYLLHGLLKGLEQFLERLDELIHGLVLQLLSDVINFDVEFRQIEKKLFGLLEPLFQSCFETASIAIGVQRVAGDRIDGVGADQFLDVLDVTVFRMPNCGQPFTAVGHFDQHVRPIEGFPYLASFIDRGFRIVGQSRRDLQADETVPPV